MYNSHFQFVFFYAYILLFLQEKKKEEKEENKEKKKGEMLFIVILIGLKLRWFADMNFTKMQYWKSCWDSHKGKSQAQKGDFVVRYPLKICDAIPSLNTSIWWSSFEYSLRAVAHKQY